MEQLSGWLLSGTVLAAVCGDLRFGRIPNRLIVAGLLEGMICQLAQYRAAGLVMFLGGSLLPILLLGVLFYFRMIGAGDVKLFCVVGGFLGAPSLLRCMALAGIVGAIWSAGVLWKRRLWAERLGYFVQYVLGYAKERHWKRYLDGVDEAGKIPFSLPILASVLCYVGGWI